MPTQHGIPKREGREEQAAREQLQAQFPETTKWDKPESAWQWLIHNETYKNDVHVFDEINFAEDGGLSEIGHYQPNEDNSKVNKDKLWYASRPFSSIVLLLFVFYNVYYLMHLDGRVVEEFFQKEGFFGMNASTSSAVAALPTHVNHQAGLPTPEEISKKYLISKSILDTIWPTNDIDARLCVTLIELSILFWMLLVLLWDVRAIFFSRGYSRWKGIAEICWIDLPQLSIFSAIKLLEYIVPQKLSYDLFVIFFYIDDKAQKWKEFAMFLVSRPFFLIVGMDMFLIKYRLVFGNIMVSADHVQFSDITAGLIFLNQVIGVVNLSFTIRSRLYRFVFAGEEGVMDHAEEVRRDVWEAFVAFKVFNNTGSLRDDGDGNKVLTKIGVPPQMMETAINYSIFKSVCLMLSWCDDDFQMLSLNDAEQPKHESEKDEGEKKGEQKDEEKGGCVVI